MPANDTRSTFKQSGQQASVSEPVPQKYPVEIHLISAGKSVETFLTCTRESGEKWAFDVAVQGFALRKDEALIVYAPANIAFVRIDWKHPVAESAAPVIPQANWRS